MNKKLNAEQAQAIVHRACAGETQKKLAAEYGVSTAAVSKLIRGLSWPELERPEGGVVRQRRTKLTPEDIRAIHLRLIAHEKPGEIAQDYGVTRQAIVDIQKGKTWAHIPKPGAPSPAPRRRRVWEQ